jgi:hypothetical protein
MSNTLDTDELFGRSSSSPAQAPKSRVGADTRREVRMHVKWAARALLADGRVVPMNVRDISERGVGLVSERPIPQHATLRVAVSVPDLHTPGRFTTVIGSVKTAHITVSGPDLIYGGVWQALEGNGSEIIRKWVLKLQS